MIPKQLQECVGDRQPAVSVHYLPYRASITTPFPQPSSPSLSSHQLGLVPVAPCVRRHLRVQALVGRARIHAPNQHHRLAHLQRSVEVPRIPEGVVQREVDCIGSQLEREVWTAPVTVLDAVRVAESFCRKVVAISDQLRFRQKLRARQATTPEAHDAVEKRAAEGRHHPPGYARGRRREERVRAGDEVTAQARQRSQ